MGGARPSRERKLADKLATARAVGPDLRRRIAHGDLDRGGLWTRKPEGVAWRDILSSPATQMAGCGGLRGGGHASRA